MRFWNRNLNGKLRIIVLNNGGGAIFGKFQGLKESQAREEMIMAKHHVTAEGICSQNEVKYLAAHTDGRDGTGHQPIDSCRERAPDAPGGFHRYGCR